MKGIKKLLAKVKANPHQPHKGFIIYWDGKYIADNGRHIIMSTELETVLEKIELYLKEH